MFCVVVVCPGAAQELQLTKPAAPAGVKVYPDGHYGILNAELSNPAAGEAEALVLVRSESAKNQMQFGVRTWVPAGATREVYLPYWFQGAKAGAQSWDVETLVVTGEHRHETSSAASPSSVMYSGRRPEGVITVIDSGADRAATQEVKRFTKRSGDRWRTVALPWLAASTIQQPLALDTTDVLVLGSLEQPLGEAQTDAVRRWLAAGGYLWLMVDRPGVQETAQRLLGSTWDLKTLGEVEIVEGVRSGAHGGGPPGSGESSYLMRRVWWPSGRVMHEVQGYPALLSGDYGDGQVMVSTLPLSAWITGKKKKAEAKVVADMLAMLKEARAAALPVSIPTALAGNTPSLSVALQEFGRGQIAYEVPGRGGVFAVLAAFVVLLVVGGWWLRRVGRPEWFAGVAGAGVVLAGGVLIGIGLMQQSTVPATLATAQVIKYLPGQSLAEGHSTHSVYRPPIASNPGLVGGQGVQPEFEKKSLAEGATRLVWTGREDWRYEMFDLAPGIVHTVKVNGVRRLDRPVEAWIDVASENDEATLRGTITGLAEEAGLSDVLLATQGGHYQVRLTGDGKFVLNGQELLAKGAYIRGSTGGVLSTKQIARNRVLAAAVADRKLIQGPTLLGWTRGEPIAATWGEANEESEQSAPTIAQPREALVAIPLRVAPPSSTQSVNLPSALMTFKQDRSLSKANVFDFRTLSWVAELSISQKTWMRFYPPPGVHLSQVTQARVTLDIKAPQRPVRVLTQTDGRVRELASLDGPSGRMLLVFEGDDAPDVQDDGSILLCLAVDEDSLDPATPGTPTQTPRWTVYHFNLGLSGITEPATLSTPSETN